MRLAEATRRTELKRKERTRDEGIRSADALRDDVGAGPRDDRGGATTKTGTKGDDVLRGTPQADEFHGQAGDDKLYGGAGGDTIVGGWGRDRIRARDATRDIVDCGKGVDRVLVDPSDELRSCELRVRP